MGLNLIDNHYIQMDVKLARLSDALPQIDGSSQFLESPKRVLKAIHW